VGQAIWLTGQVAGGVGWRAGSRVHAPLTQAWPEGQSRPQLPQLLRSLLTSVHPVTGQEIWLTGQVARGVGCRAGSRVHAPLTHAWPAGQSRPQLPQFLASLLTSVHPVGQAIWLGAQETAPNAE
jgi:hypothetical protein